jgi:hypothetical protein
MTAMRAGLVDALKDTQRYIDKEEPRSDDLRPAKTKELLEWYKNHKKKLLGMIEALDNLTEENANEY